MNVNGAKLFFLLHDNLFSRLRNTEGTPQRRGRIVLPIREREQFFKGKTRFYISRCVIDMPSNKQDSSRTGLGVTELCVQKNCKFSIPSDINNLLSETQSLFVSNSESRDF